MTENEREIFETHERLKMNLRLKGTSLAELARELGVSRTTMSLVGLRKLNNPRIEHAIAHALGQSADGLFQPIANKGAEE